MSHSNVLSWSIMHVQIFQSLECRYSRNERKSTLHIEEIDDSFFYSRKTPKHGWLFSPSYFPPPPFFTTPRREGKGGERGLGVHCSLLMLTVVYSLPIVPCWLFNVNYLLLTVHYWVVCFLVNRLCSPGRLHWLRWRRCLWTECQRNPPTRPIRFFLSTVFFFFNPMWVRDKESIQRKGEEGTKHMNENLE